MGPHFVLMLTVCAAAALAFAAHADPAKPGDQQPTEDDWWLPDWVEASPNIGVYGGRNLPPSVKLTRMVELTWREVEPVEGQYGWSKLERELQGDGDIWLRLRNSDVAHCPKWLSDKYPDLTPMPWLWPEGGYPDAMGGYSQGSFYPLWHAGFDAEFKELLTDFRGHHYGSHPKLRFIYVPGAWRWNEWSLKFVQQMRETGVTPEDFIAWFESLIDAYIESFDGLAHKLVYTGMAHPEWTQGDDEFAAKINPPGIGNVMCDYAVKRGCSARTGWSEVFNWANTDFPSLGTKPVMIGDARYMVTDDDSPFLRDPRRIFGTENEEFRGNYYLAKMGTLKMLQFRMNWVFMSNYQIAPPLFDWSLKEMGKTYRDAPDAWVVLREWYDGHEQDYSRAPPSTWLRNWERWLIQREVEPDGLTERTYMTGPVKGRGDDMNLNGISYEARRTDHALGSDYMYFGVDDKFLKGGRNSVQIKVTYWDDNTSTWWIEYDSAGEDAYKRSASIENTGDGQWKTATFEIEDAGFGDRQRQGMDFRIYNGGEADLTVRFVRLIKLVAPAAVASP